MTENDLLRASPAKLNELARFYGLHVQGKRNIWWARKSCTHPLTRKQHFFKWSTQTPDLRTALLRAVPKIEHFLAGIQTHLIPAIRSPSAATDVEWAKIKDLYEVGGPGQVATRRRNLRSIEIMVDAVYPDRGEGRILCGLISGRLVRLWQQSVVAAATVKYLPHDVEAFERAKRSANSDLGKAQSVFSRRMCRFYEDNGISLPSSVREFASEIGLEAAPAPPPRMLTDDVVQRIRDGLPALKTNDPGTWACLMLMYHGGLRNVEAEKARWSWLSTVGETVMLCLDVQGEFKPKASGGMVSFDKAVIAELATVRIDDYIVPASNATRRKACCQRGVNDYLRDCGVEKLHGKIAYRLRGHAVSTVILKNGIDAAQEFARHAQRSTTMRHYKGVAVPYQPIKAIQ